MSGTAPFLDTSLAEARNHHEQKAQERQAAADERALRSKLNARVTRIELSRVITPVAAAAQQHEVLLTFISERGLVVRDGRAYLDEQDLKEYLEEKRAGVAASE